jgi:hypothetical protein
LAFIKNNIYGTFTLQFRPQKSSSTTFVPAPARISQTDLKLLSDNNEISGFIGHS